MSTIRREAGSRERFGWRVLRAVGDLLMGGFALLVALSLRVETLQSWSFRAATSDDLVDASPLVVIVVVTQTALLYFFGFYDSRAPQPRFQQLRRLLLAVVLQGLLVSSSFFFREVAFPRSTIVILAIANIAFLFLFRQLVDRYTRPRARRVLLVGSSRTARELARDIARYHWHGLDVVGWVPSPEDGDSEPPEAEELGPRLGGLEDVGALLEAGVADEVLCVSGPDNWQTRLLDSLSESGDEPCVLLLPSPFETVIGSIRRYRFVNDVPLIEVSRGTTQRLRQPIKRSLDLLLSLPLVLLSVPLIVAGGLLIRMGSRGPMFYRQVRVGRNRRQFTVWKLRTMRVDAEAGGDERLAAHDDPRVVPYGHLLRGLRIDELPQLLNVLIGSMSLVGPRPERPGFVERFLNDVPGYGQRFEVAPGLTGLAQVNGEYHSSAPNKLRYDLAYIANWSLWLDLSILVRTVKIVLTSRGV